MKWTLITIIFLLLTILQGLLTTSPFSLSLLIALSATTKKLRVFILAILSGMILDILNLKPIGLTSTIFVLILFILFLYDRNFETRRPMFVLMFSFVSAFLYSLTTSIKDSLPSAIISSLFALIMFQLLLGIEKIKPIKKQKRW